MTSEAQRTVTLNGREYDVQRLSLTRGLRVITLLNQLQKVVPDVGETVGNFVREYRATHFEVLSRAEAKMRYGGGMPIYDEDDQPIVRDGQVLTTPAPIDTMTEADWAAAGNELKRREDPPLSAIIAAVFPEVVEHGEQPLLRLLAVAITDDALFREQVGTDTWQARADELARDVLGPAPLDEVIELAVVVGEMAEGQVLGKVRSMGDRVGKLRARLWPRATTTPAATSTADSATSSEQPEPSSEAGSSPSPADSGGTPPPSEPFPGTPSAPSPTSGSESETEQRSTGPVEAR